MKGRKSILAMISAVLVFFLFAPVLIRTINAISEGNFKCITFRANTGTPTKLETQFPFEEREKEEEAVTHSLASLPLIAILTESLTFRQSAFHKLQLYQVSLKCELPPRYLLIRSLLI